jgi:hypothetical protein
MIPSVAVDGYAGLYANIGPVRKALILCGCRECLSQKRQKIIHRKGPLNGVLPSRHLCIHAHRAKDARKPG